MVSFLGQDYPAKLNLIDPNFPSGMDVLGSGHESVKLGGQFRVSLNNVPNKASIIEEMEQEKQSENMSQQIDRQLGDE